MMHWAANVLDLDTPAGRRRNRQREWYFSLGNLLHLVRNLILLRAARMAMPRRPHRAQRIHHRLPAARLQFFRRLAGARLRRALKHSDTATMLARLADALRNIDHHARAIVRRLKRGLTRLAPKKAARSTDALVRLHLAAPCFTDSS